MIKKFGKKIGDFVTGEKLSLKKAFDVMAAIDGLNRMALSPSGKNLRNLQVKAILKAFNPKTKSIWTSVLFPAEILYPFEIYPLTLEVLAGIMSTAGISNHFIDLSDSRGVPPAMCSFHRMIIGLSASGFLPRPTAVGSTSTMCDGNSKTFAIAAKEASVPLIFLDVPFAETKASVSYLKDQLMETVLKFSDMTGKRLSEEVWRGQAMLVNKALLQQRELFKSLINNYKNLYRGFELANFAFTFHYLLGTKGLADITFAMAEDAKNGHRPRKVYKDLTLGEKTKRLMWLHITPQYDTPIWGIIDNGISSKIVCDEYSAPYATLYDEDDFFGSVAKRLINHPSNGGIERRIENIIRVAKEFKIDGAIHYNSWGCHQAAGNISLLEDTLRKNGFNFLSLSGDAADKRNSSIEQHRTRLEAFLE